MPTGFSVKMPSSMTNASQRSNPQSKDGSRKPEALPGNREVEKKTLVGCNCYTRILFSLRKDWHWNGTNVANITDFLEMVTMVCTWLLKLELCPLFQGFWATGLHNEAENRFFPPDTIQIAWAGWLLCHLRQGDAHNNPWGRKQQISSTNKATLEWQTVRNPK